MSTVLTDLTLSGKTYTVTLAEQPVTPSECPPGQHKDTSGNCVPDIVNPPPGPLSPPTSNNIGPDGVMQIYPTVQGGTEFYMKDNPDKSKFNVSFGSGSHLPYQKKTENGLIFFNTTGSPINYNSGSPPGRSTRLDVYPDGGMWSNKTKNSWENNPGYLYSPKGIKNGEFTSFIRVHGNLGTHQAYAHKVGGRDEDAIRSLIEMVYPTATHGDIQVNYNYAHFPYVNAKPNIKFSPPTLAEDRWVGVKTVRKVAADKKSSTLEMWVDLDPFDGNGKPRNSWKPAATYVDKGTSGYGNVPCTWACHKDLVRVDGFASVDFALFSDREIDPNATPSTAADEHKAAVTAARSAARQEHTALQADPVASVEEEQKQ
ncbi:MAG TPA: hypothetical protein VFI70_00100 [Nitrososphaeraceae archaeon]|nr:hypothetical protein [Nitrososphaeraceae archaeon]